MTKEHGFWRRCGYVSFVCRDLLDGKVSFEKISWRQRGGHLLNMKLEEALKFSGPRLLSKKLSEKNFSNVFSPFFIEDWFFGGDRHFPRSFQICNSSSKKFHFCASAKSVVASYLGETRDLRWLSFLGCLYLYLASNPTCSYETSLNWNKGLMSAKILFLT